MLFQELVAFDHLQNQIILFSKVQITDGIDLEKSFNEAMIGKPGLQRFEVNAYGKRIKELKFVQGISGKNFKTTIDQEIQKFVTGLIKSLKYKFLLLGI